MGVSCKMENENLEEQIEKLTESVNSTFSAATGLQQMLLKKCVDGLKESKKWLKENNEKKQKIMAEPGYHTGDESYLNESIEFWQKQVKTYEELVKSYSNMGKSG